MWISADSRNFEASESFVKFCKMNFLAKVSAIDELSYMTLPNYPVTFNYPVLPCAASGLLNFDDSIYKMLPPCELYASPMTTPAGMFL